jgi:hypothetical protein
MRLDFGTWLLSMSPLAIGFGAWAAIATCVVLAAAALATNMVFTAGERRDLLASGRESLGAFLPFLNRRETRAT